jgi:hypothetical protein
MVAGPCRLYRRPARITLRWAALATLVLATAAHADVEDRQCQMGRGGGWVRAGTPCVIHGPGYCCTEIIDPPHNGTAVPRADGSIYYSPKPDFTGGDHIAVRFANRFACQLPEKLQDRFIGPRCHRTPIGPGWPGSSNGWRSTLKPVERRDLLLSRCPAQLPNRHREFRGEA